MKIVEGGLDNPMVTKLLHEHLAQMHENSPVGSVFALDTSALRAPEIQFWTAWEDNQLMGCGALKAVTKQRAEVKSMRTHQEHLRKGVAAKILEHIMTEARLSGFKILSLETGSGEVFDPALSLYRKYGFTQGEAFGGYLDSDFNQFFHLALE